MAGCRFKESRTARYEEPCFLGLVDDLEFDARARVNPIQEEVAVAGLADGTRGDCAHLADTVPVHDLAKAFERRKRRVGGAGMDDAGTRKGVATDLDPSRRLLDDTNLMICGDLGDNEPDRGGAHVEHGRDSG